RGSAPRRPGLRGARARGLGQCAHHLLLGAVVEHAPPGRERLAHRGPQDGRDHARGHARDGTRGLGLHHRGGPAPGPLDHPRTRGARPLDTGARPMIEWLSMGGYAYYVWMSYGALAIAIVAELLVLASRRRRALEQQFRDDG